MFINHDTSTSDTEVEVTYFKSIIVLKEDNNGNYGYLIKDMELAVSDFADIDSALNAAINWLDSQHS